MEIAFFVRTLILALAVVTTLVLAIAVFRSNPRSATNRIYTLLSVVIVAWMTFNYLSILPQLVDKSLTLIRFSIFAAAPMVALFFLLTHTMPGARLLVTRKRLLIFGLFTAVAMIVALSPFAFTSLNIVDGSPNPAVGPGMGVFALIAISFMVAAVYVLIKKLSKAVGLARQQIYYVITGIVLMFGLILATVFIPVVLFSVNFFVAFIPLYTIIFLLFTTVAIVKHRLFDIRTVIARSVAYLLVVATFVIAYTVAALVLSYTVLNNERIEPGQHIGYIALALVFAPTVYWLKKVFDKVTNRLFFRDAYNAQDFFDRLNKVLVSTIDIKELLSRSARLIEKTIKPEFCEFVILPLGGQDRRIVGSDMHARITVKDMGFLQEQLRGHKGVTVAEELSEKHARMHSFLSAKDIGVLASLGGSGRDSKGYGYMIMGPKKSGNMYSQQDIRTIEIVANELSIAIQNALHFEEIKNFNRTLQEKIDDATHKLRKTNERLRILDQTKDDFISMASHQLRTPLTSVKGYVSMVLDGDAGKITDTQRKLLTQSFLSAQRMVYLISDLLNVSRLKTGKFVIEPVESKLDEVIGEELEQLVETVKSRGLTLEYHKPEHFPELMIDETKIRQVVMNFVDNAIYYTPNGGHIDVYLEDKSESVEFRVVDNGIGVPRHEQHHLFTKFYRARNARNARPDGTGLGLFMAKKVIVAQGGAIVFKSTEGKGSTFGFSFPKAKLLVKHAPKTGQPVAA